MRKILGRYETSIASLELEERYLYKNTLILGEKDSGKTHLASKIRFYVIDNNVPTLYLDFSDPEIDAIEARFKDEHFNYIRFEDSERFRDQLQEMIDAKQHIYMAVNPRYFSSARDDKSRVSQMLEMSELRDNYYYFFHEIARLNGFYTEFKDFLPYIFGLVYTKKYGMTFLTQPHETFENPQIKLLFTFLYLGRCSNANYFNTAILKGMPKYRYLYQRRSATRSLLFNNIKADLVTIDS